MGTFSLVEDGADCCRGGIDHNLQLGIRVGKDQRYRLGKTGFHAVKGSPLFGGRFYGAVVSTSQRCEGRCYFRTVWDETAKIDFDHMLAIRLNARFVDSLERKTFVEPLAILEIRDVDVTT